MAGDLLPSEPVGNHSTWDIVPDGKFLIAERRGRLGMIFNWSPPRDDTR